MLLLLLGCHGGDSDTDGIDTDPPPSTVCAEAEERLGQRACVNDVTDAETWGGITVPGGGFGLVRVTKYVAPVDDIDVPVMFADAHNYPLHYDLLVDVLPELFSGLTPPQYNELVVPADRRVWAGAVYELEGEPKYAFTIVDDPADGTTAPLLSQVDGLWKQLRGHFEIGELAFMPSSPAQEATAPFWIADFEIVGLPPVDYEVYTPGVGFGTVRTYTLAELADAEANAAFGYQDVLVLEDVPRDVERPIAAAVTGGRQSTLSHLNVRSAQRGTPNCFVRDAMEVLAEWEGQLVRIECGEETLTVSAATQDEAEAYWDSIRPDPLVVPPPDEEFVDLVPLLEIPTATAEERGGLFGRYGAKTSNLAVLYQRIPAELQFVGFGIPVGRYRAHASAFDAELEGWLQDPEFQTDGLVRKERLESLQQQIQDAPLDPELLEALTVQIRETFGTDAIEVRFRSSSNAEDSQGFMGAGLYTSVTGCLADDLDGDDEGPSRCEADENHEQTVADAIREVWASLWGVSAYEERDWYGIDPRNVAMGVLVVPRTADEQANIVAFTGNPTADVDGWLINAQEGEEEVVSTDPGIVPESISVEVVDGDVVGIQRISPSSIVAGGEVLTDAEVTELGESLWTVDQAMPRDVEVPEGGVFMWDTEWKILEDGRLVVKQIRPFVRAD